MSGTGKIHASRSRFSLSEKRDIRTGDPQDYPEDYLDTGAVKAAGASQFDSEVPVALVPRCRMCHPLPGPSRGPVVDRGVDPGGGG